MVHCGRVFHSSVIGWTARHSVDFELHSMEGHTMYCITVYHITILHSVAIMLHMRYAGISIEENCVQMIAALYIV